MDWARKRVERPGNIWIFQTEVREDKARGGEFLGWQKAGPANQLFNYVNLIPRVTLGGKGLDGEMSSLGLFKSR